MLKSVLILDCGATNVKACLVDTRGKIIASHSLANETVPDPNYAGGLIWDIDSIWNKLSACCRNICSGIKDTEIIAVTVTTFGVDGAAMKTDGTLCYPVISWQCSRTGEIEKNVSKYFDPEWLYKVSGLQSYHFNTIHKLIWLRENRPDVLGEMDYYVMMPSLILYKLSGRFVTDATMAGTSMLTDLKKRTFSDEILKPLGLDKSIFPPMVEPGTIIGKVTRIAAESIGIKPGVAVIAAGHDTQFAILGSGGGVNQPVLSSGTWEILMVRSPAATLQIPLRESGITIELDSRPGLVNPGVQWVASGVLEWMIRILYSDLPETNSKYSTMISEAADIPPGSGGVTVIPELFPGGYSGKKGNINGFTHETKRAHIYRATLESLCFYARNGLEKLQKAGNYQAENVICVGGGSKNKLWNQIRADVLGIPVRALDMKETTALGAALVAFTAMGVYTTVEEAFQALDNRYAEYFPGKDTETYRKLYDDYAREVFN
jgi:L-fuculokinase